jgi:hypothetical protein
MARIKVRGLPTSRHLGFTRRARERFVDPAFDPLQGEIGKIIEAAWNGYHEYRKAPRTKRAGPRYADPDYELSIDWIRSRDAIARAERTQKQAASRSRILLVNGSSRSDQSCPGEMSKTFRLVEIAQRVIAAARRTSCFRPSLLTRSTAGESCPARCRVSPPTACHGVLLLSQPALGQVND